MNSAHHLVSKLSISHRLRRSRDASTILFAAAFDGDTRAEDELRRLAIHSDRAGDALAAVGYSYGLSESRRLEHTPSDVAALDQLIAAALAALKVPR